MRFCARPWGAGCALGLLLAVAVAVPAQAGVTVLPPTSALVKAPAAMKRSCVARELSSSRGVSVTQWTATDDGSVTARLGGDEQNDWDLALFDAASGRRLDASEAPGANEVVQALVRRGQTLLIQACRLDGSAARERLTISPVATPLAQTVPKPAQQSLVSIPIGGPQDIPALEALGAEPRRGRLGASGHRRARRPGPGGRAHARRLQLQDARAGPGGGRAGLPRSRTPRRPRPARPPSPPGGPATGTTRTSRPTSRRSCRTTPTWPGRWCCPRSRSRAATSRASR